MKPEIQLPKSPAPERATHWVLLEVALLEVVLSHAVSAGFAVRKELPPVSVEAVTQLEGDAIEAEIRCRQVDQVLRRPVGGAAGERRVECDGTRKADISTVFQIDRVEGSGDEIAIGIGGDGR